MTNGRRFLGLAVLAIFSVACGSDSTPSADRSVDAVNSITLLTPGDDYLLSPLGWLPEMHLLSDPLSDIATRERQADGRTWLYRLRPGIRWQDGVPFTTRDIEFTWRFNTHPDVLAEDPESQALSVLDDSTFTITFLKGREAPISYGVYLPAHLLDGRDPAERHDWEYWRHPIGYGPYRFVRNVPGEFIELEANPDWHRGRARIDRVFLKLGGNAVAELLAGNVDVASVSILEAKPFEADPRFNVYWPLSGSPKLNHIIWNHRHPVLGDVRVRKALAMAIDRDELARALDFPEVFFQSRWWDVWITAGQLERGDYPDPLPFDLEAAAALLNEAGWRDEDGDGIRERNGQRLTFEIVTGQPRSSIAVLLQSQFHRVGADVSVAVMEQGAANARGRDGNFDALLTSNNSSVTWDALVNTESNRAFSGYANPEFDRLATVTVWTPEEQEAKLRALWPIFHEDIPATLVLPYTPPAVVARRRVKGLESPFRADPLFFLTELRIEEEDTAAATRAMTMEESR
jgi:peptide/nickel transport system substrate-binding protein